MLFSFGGDEGGSVRPGRNENVTAELAARNVIIVGVLLMVRLVVLLPCHVHAL